MEVPEARARTAYLETLRLRKRRELEATTLKRLYTDHRHAFENAAEHLDEEAAPTKLEDLKARRDAAEKRLAALPVVAPSPPWGSSEVHGPCK